MGNLEEFKKTVWIFLSVSHSLEQKENKMLCCNQIMFSEALCWQVHNSFTTSIKTQILGREWQHFQMERSGAQKHQVSHSQLPTWPCEKIFLFHWKSNWLSLMVEQEHSQDLGTEVWIYSCSQGLFPSIQQIPVTFPMPTSPMQPQQELTVMSQLKPVKVFGNTQLTLLPKRENFDILLEGCPNKVMVEDPTISMEDHECLLLTSLLVVWVVFLTSPN